MNVGYKITTPFVVVYTPTELSVSNFDFYRLLSRHILLTEPVVYTQRQSLTAKQGTAQLDKYFGYLNKVNYELLRHCCQLNA